MNRNEKEGIVKGVFSAISGKYDLFDSLMSLGMDRKWRKIAVDALNLKEGSKIADIGAGTGKVTQEILSKNRNCLIEALDITEEMFPRDRMGVNFTLGSAVEMPFEDEEFAGCISCFLTRNVPSLETYIGESYRILAKDGIFVNMDIFDPGKNLIAPAFRFYFYKIMPKILDLASGTNSYSYLARSVKSFVTPNEFARVMQNKGFTNIKLKKLAGGTVYIHSGIK